MSKNRPQDTLGVDYALQFTEAYKLGSKKNIFIRETLCEHVQFPAVLVSPSSRDLLCGKRIYPEVGYSVQYGGLGYYFNSGRSDSQSEEEQKKWLELESFWEKENTTSKCLNEFDREILNRLPGVFGSDPLVFPAYTLFRMAGLQLDYGKLIQLGIPGLESEILSIEESNPFYDALLASVNRIKRCISFYISEVEKLEKSEKTIKMKSALSGILKHKPQTFHEGLQLVLLVQTMSGTINFGRLDTVLGPLLSEDLNKGILCWREALDLLKSFYTIIEEEIIHFDGRIIIGGMGRDNEEAADRFAMLAMETTDSLSLPMPQLSLRFYKGQNPELLEKAYDIIGRGRTFPMLYNDDVNVPAVEKAFHVNRQTAEQYIPFGCGEYMINFQSCGTPNFIINLTKCLELALNQGRDISSGVSLAPDFGTLSQWDNFDELWNAYKKTTEYFLEQGAKAQDSIYKTTGRECPYSLISLLYDDCITRGLPLFCGGVKYLGGTNETYGNTNAADSLTAINELIFKKKLYNSEDLLKAIKDNWEGYNIMREEFLKAPKYGNDNEMADQMIQKVHNHVCLHTSSSFPRCCHQQ